MVYCEIWRYFYEIINSCEIYKTEIKPYAIDFINKAPKACPQYSFFKIDIDET